MKNYLLAAVAAFLLIVSPSFAQEAPKAEVDPLIAEMAQLGQAITNEFKQTQALIKTQSEELKQLKTETTALKQSVDGLKGSIEEVQKQFAEMIALEKANQTEISGMKTEMAKLNESLPKSFAQALSQRSSGQIDSNTTTGASSTTSTDTVTSSTASVNEYIWRTEGGKDYPFRLSQSGGMVAIGEPIPNGVTGVVMIKKNGEYVPYKLPRTTSHASYSYSTNTPYYGGGNVTYSSCGSGGCGGGNVVYSSCGPGGCGF